MNLIIIIIISHDICSRKSTTWTQRYSVYCRLMMKKSISSSHLRRWNQQIHFNEKKLLKQLFNDQIVGDWCSAKRLMIDYCSSVLPLSRGGEVYLLNKRELQHNPSGGTPWDLISENIMRQIKFWSSLNCAMNSPIPKELVHSVNQQQSLMIFKPFLT